jgi:OmpA-OmpF porin, OOP family
MKKIVMLTVMVMLMVMLMAAVKAAQAEVRADSVSVSPFIGGYFFEGNEKFKDDFTAGLRAGYNFTKHWGVEGFFNYVPAKFKDIPDSYTNNIYDIGIEGLFHFMPDGRFVPFLAVGIGGIHYGEPEPNVPNKFSVDYGAGLKYFLTDNIALRADVRHVLPLGHERYNNLLSTLGVTFSFGGKKKEVAETKVEEPVAVAVAPIAPAPVAPAPIAPTPVAPVKAVLDSDNDGVPDNLDKCPNTPAGVAVDKNGCVPKKVSIAIYIKFDTAKYVIKKKYHKNIKKVADFIKEYPDANVVIEGHTDNVDIYHQPERNVRLSYARANSVRQYLIDNFAINSSRITAAGYGPNRPIASNNTKKGRQKNRRSEIEAIIQITQIK